MQRSMLGRFSVGTGTAVVGVALSLLIFTGCSAPVATGSQNTDPLPTATIPAPNGGSTQETVAPVEPGPTQDAELGSTADLEGGVSIAVTEVQSLDVTANTPGEIAGPAVSLTISVENSSDADIDLSTTMVSVTGAAGSYGQATTSEPYSPFLGSLSPGAEASAVYVFRLPAEEHGSLQVSVEYIAGAPIALFAGNI